MHTVLYTRDLWLPGLGASTPIVGLALGKLFDPACPLPIFAASWGSRQCAKIQGYLRVLSTVQSTV